MQTIDTHIEVCCHHADTLTFRHRTISQVLGIPRHEGWHREGEGGEPLDTRPHYLRSRFVIPLSRNGLLRVMG